MSVHTRCRDRCLLCADCVVAAVACVASDLEEESEIAVDLLVLPVLLLCWREGGPRAVRNVQSGWIVPRLAWTLLIDVATIRSIQPGLTTHTQHTETTGKKGVGGKAHANGLCASCASVF